MSFVLCITPHRLAVASFNIMTRPVCVEEKDRDPVAENCLKVLFYIFHI